MFKEDAIGFVSLLTSVKDLSELPGLIDAYKMAADVLDSGVKEKDSGAKFLTKKTGFHFVEQLDVKGGSKEIFVPDYDGLADYIQHAYKIMADDAVTYIYEDNHYKSIGVLHLQKIINDLIMTQSTPAKVNNFYKKTLIKNYSNMSEVILPSGLLNCNNGVLNVRTGQLTDHNPKHFFKYILGHDYLTDAECPVFMRSLELVTNGDKQLKRLIAQVFGYCIIGGIPRAQKAFMFYGEGGNGKSTILSALRGLVGKANCSSVPLTLFDKPFSMVSLDGKLVNIIDETPKKNINPEAFKNVVTGGYVRAAEKGKPEFDLCVNARIIFACNSLPKFGDSSEGLRRRLVIIPFNHRISDRKADKDIEFKIANEMSGILNFALSGLRDLVDNNYIFCDSEAVQLSLEEFKRETDSVYDFLSEYSEFFNGHTGGDIFTSTSDSYRDYLSFCKINNAMPCGKNEYGKRSKVFFRDLFAKNGVTLAVTDTIKRLKHDGIGKTTRGISRVRINYTIDN